MRLLPGLGVRLLLGAGLGERLRSALAAVCILSGLGVRLLSGLGLRLPSWPLPTL